MIKKIFWLAVAVCVILLILFNSHETVTFSYIYGEPIKLKLDLMLMVTFASGILCVLISNLIGTSQQLFLNLLSYPTSKKKDKLQAIFDKALIYVKLENYKKGKELLLYYVKEEPSNPDAYICLADIYLKENAREAAEEILKKGFLVNKDNIKMLNKLCDVYVDGKKFNKAIKLLEEIREKVVTKAAYSKRIYDIYVLQKDYKKAYDIQKELEKDDYFKEFKEDFLRTKYNLAIALLNEGNVAEAEKRLKALIAKEKNFYGAYVDYAKILVKEGKTKDAIEFLLNAYKETKFPHFAKIIGELYLTEEKPQQALLFYQGQLGQLDDNLHSPQFLTMYALYVRLLLKLEMITFAIETLNEIIGTEGDKMIFHILLAECCFRHQRYEESAKEYHKFLDTKIMPPIKMKCNKCEIEFTDFSTVCAKCGSYNSINYFLN